MVRLRREIEGVRPNRAIPMPSYSLDAAASGAVLPALDRWLQGCEPGRTLLAGGVRQELAIALAQAGHWVTVSDLDADQLDQLHARLTPSEAGRLTLVDRGYGDAAFAPSSFDLVVIFDAMHTYFEPAWLVNKAARELKPDGMLAARVLTRGSAAPLQPWSETVHPDSHVDRSAARAAQRGLAGVETLLRSKAAPALCTPAATDAVERGAHFCAQRFATDLTQVLAWYNGALTLEKAFVGHSLRLQAADALFGLRHVAHEALLAALQHLPPSATSQDLNRPDARVVGLVARKRLGAASVH